MAKDSAYDFQLAGRGYILARREDLTEGGRAWVEEWIGSSVAQLTPTELRFGNQPSTIEIPMVFRSGHLGYGDGEFRADGRYRYTLDMDARFKEQIIPGPAITDLTIGGSVAVSGFFEHDEMLFCLGGRYCKQIPASGSTVVTAKDFGEGKVATDALVYNDVAYVGMGYSEPFWTRISNAAPTLSWSQASALYIGKMARFKDRFWASVSAHEVKCVATAPTVSGNWSALYPIGESDHSITALAELADLLYIGKSDGLYALGVEGLGKRLTPELKAFVKSTNCENMAAWHGSLWVPHIRGFLNYRHLGESGFLVTSASPGDGVDGDNPVYGRITAMAGEGKWLFAALYTPGGDTYIMAAREPVGDEAVFGRLIWHPLRKITGKRCDAMHISALWGNPRLFFGQATDVGYIVLPRNSDNPLLDSNCSYATTGSISYPAHSWNVPTTKKVWKSAEVASEKLSPAAYLTLHYSIDGQSEQEAGRVTLSPAYEVAFADEGLDGLKMGVRVEYNIPNATRPLILRSVTVRGVERPRRVRTITATIRASNDLRTRLGTKCNRTVRDMLDELDALANGHEAVRLVDVWGRQRRVLVLQGVRPIEIEQEGNLSQELLIEVPMAEFEAETTESTASYWVWGQSTWGGGDVWAPR